MADFFGTVGDFFARLFGKRKPRGATDWESLDYGKPAKPKNLQPLDPNDPWKI